MFRGKSRYAFTLLLGIIGASAFGQQSNPGNPPTDSNPWNPYNWDTGYYSDVSGATQYEGWLINNGNIEPYSINYIWGTNPVPSFPGASNSTGQDKTVSATSHCTITKRIKWIGQGAAPSTVLVMIQSSVLAGGGQNLEVATPVNGLGHADNVCFFYTGDDGREASGYRFINLAINPSTGVSEEIVVEQSSTSIASGQSSYADVIHTGLQIYVAEKAIGINQFISPTYRLTYSYPSQPIKTLVPNRFIDEIDLHTVMVPDGSIFRYTTFNVSKNLYGPWLQPTTVNSNTPADLFNKAYYAEDVTDIIFGGPDEILFAASASDSITTRNAKARLYIYAPLMYPEEISDEVVMYEFVRISGIEEIPPGQTVTLSHTIQTTQTHTTTFQWGLSVPVNAAFGDIFSTGVTGSATWTEGESASISTSTASSRPITNNSLVPKYAWLERASFHKLKTLNCAYYDESGFNDIVPVEVTYFASGSKEAAESIDHITRHRLEVEFE